MYVSVFLEVYSDNFSIPSSFGMTTEFSCNFWPYSATSLTATAGIILLPVLPQLYRVLVGKPEGKRPLGRPRRRWVDNIRMDLQDVGYGYVDWNGLAQDRDRWRTLVSAVMNLRVP